MPKASELTTATALTDDDYLILVDDPAGTPATKKITAANAATYFGSAGSMVVVNHDSTADTARPDAAAVYWIGSVEPTNAEAQDLWYDTSA